MRLLALFLMLSIPALFVACGDGGGAPPAATPSAASPRNAIAFGAREGDTYGLYAVQGDGSGLFRLAQEPAAVWFPRWSPEGARVAYLVGGDRAGQPASLRVYDFGSRTASTLTEQALWTEDGPSMAWSPDARRLAYLEAVEGGRLAVYDFDQARTLTEPAFAAQALEWTSRDEIVYVPPADGGRPDFFTLQPDGAEPEPLLRLDGIEGSPAWSRESERLAFWNGPTVRIAERRLFVLGRGADTPRELGPGLDPAWSPDGEQLVFSRSVPGSDLDIFIVSLDGGEPRPVAESTTRDRWPTWSPAGDAIVYLAQADQETAFLCTALLETAEVSCFDQPGLLPTAPSWSPY